MHSTTQDPDKFRRYRERLKAKGLRQIHLWVPDTASPRFQQELRRQLALVEASTEDRETLEFIEAAADWSD
ncbi:antitoxin MazE family protein [Thioalkalivibrio paradoxus]|uniref:Antitoxin MazE n=1 Tax=Thioalkalivibrio paradoxus ARh 1 TaxID=713585 RepID=W0DG10_9GAMM|nr:antitoxin MazE family protein [Thioalkalivibrio paradoxus]AHE97291.1 hypothetical protein THITH_02295 [Thioalkalivibrio paradoxus ARh 1]